jgi:tetratricopeptide (TPR) repeat protein
MTESQNRFQQAMNQGHTAAWDQDWQRAVDYYRQALKEIPDDPIALVSLGLALYELGLYDQAMQYYSQAGEISPEDPLPFEKVSQLNELLGQLEEVTKPSLRASELYLNEGNVAKAVECLARVTRIDAENLPAHSRLALIYERTSRKNRAVTEYLIVASLLQHAGDEEKARQAVEHALTILPASPEAQEASSLIENGKNLPKPVPSRVDPDQLRQIADTPVDEETMAKEDESELDPIAEAHQNALVTLANIVFEQESGGNGRNFEGPAIDQQAIVGGTPPAAFIREGNSKKVFTHLQQAVILQGQGSEEEAAAQLELAVEAGLDHPAAYFDLGIILSQGDRLESAVRYLQRVLEESDYSLAARILLGRTLRFMGRLNEAATNYLEALRLADAQAVSKEQVEDLLRMYDPIIESEAQQTDPDVKNKLCDLIEELLFRPAWRQHLTQVRADYQIDIEGAPAVPVGDLLINPQGNRIVESILTINQYARSGYMRSAMEEAFLALQFAPTYLPLHTYMGELLLKQDHIPEAIQKFGTIAQTYRARGESLNAIQILQRIIKAAPMDLAARLQLILLLEERGRFNEAIQEKVKLADVYYNLADLTRAREVYLDAYQLAQKSGLNREISINILHYMADIELQSLNWKRAIKIYEQIRTTDPDNYQTTEKLIELNLRLGQDKRVESELDEYLSIMEFSGDGQNVQSYLEKLAEEYPDRTYLRRKKAQLYQQQGQVEEAIRELDAIGEVLLNAGDNEGAIQAIEAILELDPPNKSDYEELISQLQGEE